MMRLLGDEDVDIFGLGLNSQDDEDGGFLESGKIGIINTKKLQNDTIQMMEDEGLEGLGSQGQGSQNLSQQGQEGKDGGGILNISSNSNGGASSRKGRFAVYIGNLTWVGTNKGLQIKKS